MSRIVVIGFMGSGKTTVSRLLAERLALRTLEMDELVLERSGAPSIAAIFDQQGEARFRELEATVARELGAADNVVISTGGGVVSAPETMHALSGGGAVTVFLDTSLAELCRRLQGDTSRPLFRDAARAEALYQARLPLYRRYATFAVRTDGLSPAEIAAEIAARLTEETR